VDEKPAADAAPTAESSAAPPAAAASADTGDAAAQGQISNEEIADILDRREQARRAHDFMTADQLREELRGRGISIDDRTKMWNAEDGRKGMIGAAAPVTDGIQDDELNRLLEEREAARRQKDYSEADRVRRSSAPRRSGLPFPCCPLSLRCVCVSAAHLSRGVPPFPMRRQIRDELKQKGVTLDDRTRVWQSIDGRRGMIGGGPMAGGMGGGTVPTAGTPSWPTRALANASHVLFCCRLTHTYGCCPRCFASAALGVSAPTSAPWLDPLALWLPRGCCAGRATACRVCPQPPNQETQINLSQRCSTTCAPPWFSASLAAVCSAGGYGGGGTGPPSDMELQQLLDKRCVPLLTPHEQCYAAGAFVMPSPASGEEVTTADCGVVCPFPAAHREEARRGRDYDTADRIRDDLRMRGIRLDDRSKTWQSNDGRNGTFDGSGGGGFGGGARRLVSYKLQAGHMRARHAPPHDTSLRWQLRTNPPLTSILRSPRSLSIPCFPSLCFWHRLL